MENLVVVICGQTSTGKSDFAVNLALELKKRGIKSEIISADSRQVYIGLDLGTGKITKKEMRGIPHHLLDVANPKKTFTVSHFQKLANKTIDKIIKNGAIPIICGGSGFYIDAVVNGIVLPNVKPNLKLRKELQSKSVNDLFKYLEKLDFERAKTIDKNNPVRLIRAIEIATELGSVPKLSHRSDLCLNTGRTCGNYNFYKIGLSLPDEVLKEKIKTRLLARIKSGMIKEVKNLNDNGLSWKRMNELGLEYRYVSQYLQNKITKDEMMEKLNTEIWHYTKRQKTWFKRDKDILWLNLTK